MTLDIDWGSIPNGGEPRIYAPRVQFARRMDDFSSKLGAGRFATGLVIGGCRGAGKTVELKRLRERLLGAGVLPVHLVLGGHRSLGQALDHAFARATGERALRMESGGKLKVSGNVPLTTIDLSWERDLKGNSKEAWMRLLALLEHPDQSGPYRVAVLIDEADLAEAGEFDANFSDLLEFASSEDAPFGVVLVGASRTLWRMTLQGKRSYTESLFDPLWLARLSPHDSANLIRQTAESFGHDWTSVDLRPVLAECHGIPRRLQNALSNLSQYVDRGDDIEAAIEQTGRDLHSRIESLRSLAATGQNHAQVRAALDLLQAHEDQSLNIEVLLEEALDEGGVPEELLTGLEALANLGLVEIDFMGRINVTSDLGGRSTNDSRQSDEDGGVGALW